VCVCVCVSVCVCVCVYSNGAVQSLSRGDPPTRAKTFPGIHTPANYCSLINQHILINDTHMELVWARVCLCVFVCVYVWLCARSVSGGDGMDLSGQQTPAPPSSPGLASCQRNVLGGNRVCRQERPGPHEPPHIDALLPKPSESTHSPERHTNSSSVRTLRRRGRTPTKTERSQTAKQLDPKASDI